VIARYGLTARKSLGQHFLFDLNLTGRIARAAGDLTAGTVIEIGPGPGGLTRALLAANAARLVVIERDSRCLEALEELKAAYPGRLEIIAGDALDVPVHRLGEAPRRIVANLPYNVATQMLLQWLGEAKSFVSMTLMFQKEVALRLAAQPGDEAYGRLSIATQWRCAVRRLFDIAPSAFTPPPQVTPSVVELLPRSDVLAPADPLALERVTAAAFGQRRKMLRSSLKSLGVPTDALLMRAGIEPTRRAEELSIPEFCTLARALTDLRASV
jgi:16S rRNA (adenine1518-N6/adenine1519-N6)-dimethyltransferase